MLVWLKLCVAALTLLIIPRAFAQYGFSDGGFDTQGAGVQLYCNFPHCPPGVWSGTTGLIHSGDVNWGGLPAPSGSTMAFVQLDHTISQTFTATTTARVRLSWLEADRPILGGQTYVVAVNGVSVGTFTSSTTTFLPRISAAFDIVAGTPVTISFTGQSPSVDRSSLIDSVQLVASGPTTTSYTYDALGRLISVSNTGGTVDGISSSYTYDNAGNRVNVTVSGAPQ